MGCGGTAGSEACKGGWEIDRDGCGGGIARSPGVANSGVGGAGLTSSGKVIRYRDSS